MEKQAHLASNLDLLWSLYGLPEEMEKNAAAMYFFSVGKAGRDEEALGHPFCKLASALRKDPWDLAEEVVVLFPAYEKIAYARGSTRSQELAKFYVDWAAGIEKDSGIRMLGRTLGWGARGASAAGRGIATAGRGIAGGARAVAGGMQRAGVSAIQATRAAPGRAAQWARRAPGQAKQRFTQAYQQARHPAIGTANPAAGGRGSFGQTGQQAAQQVKSQQAQAALKQTLEARHGAVQRGTRAQAGGKAQVQPRNIPTEQTVRQNQVAAAKQQQVAQGPTRNQVRRYQAQSETARRSGQAAPAAPAGYQQAVTREQSLAAQRSAKAQQVQKAQQARGAPGQQPVATSQGPAQAAKTPWWRDPSVMVGGAAVGVPIAGGMYLMGQGGQQPQQQQYYGG